MGAPSLKAVLLSVKPPAGADRTVAVGACTAFLTVAPPPQATAVTMRPRASLRSTGLFYPERGHVADGVEPSTVSDDTAAVEVDMAVEVDGAREAEGLVVDAAGLDP